MALPNPDHPSFGTRSAAFGLPPRPTPGRSALQQAIATGASPTLARLAAAVGGVDALESLHAAPWTPDPPDWHGVGDAARTRALEVLDLVGERADRLGAELPVVVRRLVVRAARLDPALLARGSARRMAAAAVWLALVGSTTHRSARGLRARDVWSLFEVSSCVALGRALYAALGAAPTRPVDWFAPASSSVWPADPALLRAPARAVVCELRDAALAAVEEQRARAPITSVDGRTLQLRARPLIPAWATRGVTDAGRTYLAVTFDDGSDRPFVVGLSVPDARHLVRLLGDALDAPCRART